jgi:hypothetical protein
MPPFAPRLWFSMAGDLPHPNGRTTARCCRIRYRFGGRKSKATTIVSTSTSPGEAQQKDSGNQSPLCLAVGRDGNGLRSTSVSITAIVTDPLRYPKRPERFDFKVSHYNPAGQRQFPLTASEIGNYRVRDLNTAKILSILDKGCRAGNTPISVGLI